MTKLEEIARAMAEDDPAYMNTSGLVRWRWDVMGDESRRYWMRKARAAVETLRQPTEAMLDGAREWSRVFVGSPIGNRAAIGCWQSMHAAILAEAPETTKGPASRES